MNEKLIIVLLTEIRTRLASASPVEGEESGSLSNVVLTEMIEKINEVLRQYL